MATNNKRTPLIADAPPSTDAPREQQVGAGNLPSADPAGPSAMTDWLQPAELTFLQRLELVRAVMEHGSTRMREDPIPEAQRLALGIVGAGWPLADGSPREPEPETPPAAS